LPGGVVIARANFLCDGLQRCYHFQSFRIATRFIADRRDGSVPGRPRYSIMRRARPQGSAIAPEAANPEL
ncbi:MAG: hypothetical protein Q7R41_06080, partial [Phycisphaerales bacterium]|nr:hypothetical protein [Phycisphaerales bacterium]